MSKERLIELILQSDKEHETLCCFNERPRKKQAAEIVADYLLANGVIVPPCKVGDVVYEVVAHYSYIMPLEVVGFHLGNFPTYNGHKRKPYLVCYDKTSRLLRHIPLDKLGKTVFLTRAEAEKALRKDD